MGSIRNLISPSPLKRLYMKQTIQIISFILIVILTGCSCGKIGWTVYDVYNQSNDTIYFSNGFGPPEINVYPDTSLPEKKPIMFVVSPHKFFTRRVGQNTDWGEVMKTYLPSDTLSLYIFRADTLRKYDWGTIRREYKILKRYDLSLMDLQKSNFNVYYP